ncbi:methyl-accepting chemotaxis protein [Konateibacter massiliensis]|uniref:methyl-accepting chemotaxis protein n=1 Tax=Konateibacter massiliensis TaxID=2002841 RepID=UPI000C1528F3|nr:methyl-accepting chemotaxis protein [Konateibacter massiliensis]
MFKFDQIGKKIGVLVAFIIVIVLIGISVFNYIVSRNEIEKSSKIILENAVETAMSEVNRNYVYIQEGWMTEENAKSASIQSIESLNEISAEIKADATSAATTDQTDAVASATESSENAQHILDLGESGYFFIVNSQGDIVSHPFLEGNINELKSTEGDYIVQKLVELAKAGGGIINYSLSSESSSIEDSKTVVSRYFPYWDWTVCAVIYDRDFYSGSSAILKNNLIAIPVIMFFAMGLVAVLAYRITKPIKLIARTLHKVSEGDLVQEKIVVKSKDETKLLADSVNRLLDSFNEIVQSMTTSSQQLNQFATDLNQSSNIVSKSTEEVTTAITNMAAQIEIQNTKTLDTVQSVTSLGEDIKYAAEEGRRIESVAESNLKYKEEGITSVSHLKAANLKNQENSAEIEKIIMNIADTSGDIGEITSLITNVASQTNLLALNASIEAARAGEHGVGFAVVAEEIRALANETAAAADNIRGKIAQMQSQSEEAVHFIGINKSGVEKIDETVQQAEYVIEKIGEGLQQQREGIKEIVRGNMETNRKKNNVIELLQEVADVSIENTASTEEISANAEEQSTILAEVSANISNLHGMVQDLNAIINRFRIR